jgi:DNA-binding Lrp family transcriptional regulator
VISEARQLRLRRMKEKHAEGLFLWELENGFELSPKVSELVLHSARGILIEGKTLERGRRYVVGVELGERSGKTMREAKKKEVIVTVDGGIEDLEYEEKHGRTALRGMRMLRVIEDGIEQGVVFSTEDLARVLSVSIRTVKRDVHALRKEGLLVQTRGYVEGIGRAISHKALAVEYYLQGKTYPQIEQMMHHTEHSVKRYVETFGRVAYTIRHRHLKAWERGFVLGLSKPLLKEYERLYFRAQKIYPEPLGEILGRLRAHPKLVPYKDLDRRKEGFRDSLGGKKRRAYDYARP